MRSVKNHTANYGYSDPVKIWAGGAVGTLVMSIPMYFGPAVYLPQWPVPHVLAAMVGAPLAIGWLIHFMIGWIFAAVYVLLFRHSDTKRGFWMHFVYYIIGIYTAAVCSWILLIRLGIVFLPNFFVILLPYFCEHIMFAVTLLLTIKVLSPQRIKSNYDLL